MKRFVVAMIVSGAALVVPATAEAQVWSPAEGSRCDYAPIARSEETDIAALYGGPLLATAPGATISMTCVIQVGAANMWHNGADSAVARSAANIHAAVVPPTVVSFVAPYGQPVSVCTQITANGVVYYWDAVTEGWSSSPAARCDQQPAPVARLPLPSQCDDGLDNDLDGRVDRDDPNCWNGPLELDFPNPFAPACSDGIDNDLDGRVDHPDDSDCSWPDDAVEAGSSPPQCGDGIDNDSNGRVDYPTDLGCDSPNDPVEALNPLVPQCRDGIDNDSNGRVDYPTDLGCDSPSDPVEALNPLAPQCRDGVDNDIDGRADYPDDPDCAAAGDATEGPAGPCPPPAPGVVFCLTPGSPVLTQPVALVAVGSGPTHTVVGRVDTYHFEVAPSTVVALPCVELVVDGSSTNPCALAGGEFFARNFELVRPVTEPTVGPGGVVTTVRVCHATLTATVLGFGVPLAPAYTLC